MSIDVPLPPTTGLCTMTMARRYLPARHQRSLAGCCRVAGVPLTDAHSALSDARAAAGLLRHYLALAPDPWPWSGLLRTCATLDWPSLPRTVFTPVTRSSADEPEKHFLDRIVERLPADAGEADVEPYLAVLDRALLDRHLSATEADELVDTARYLGLSREIVATAHRRYLAALADAAWEDGAVTDDEVDDLRSVAGMLGLAPEAVEGELRRAEPVRSAGGAVPSTAPVASRWTLQPGDQAVFTGASRRSRDEWHALARAASLAPKEGITKRSSHLVSLR